MLRHYVFIRYLPGTSEEHIAEFCRLMLALQGSITEIRQLHIGRDILRDARSWDVLLDMRFDSVAELRAYQQHPAHQAVMAFNQPRVAEVGAIDFSD